MELLTIEYEGNQIRIVRDSDGLRWVVRDIAKVLDFKTPHHAAKGIEKSTIVIPTTGGRHPISTVDTDGLMAILYRNRDKRKEFRDHINFTVIPNLESATGITI